MQMADAAGNVVPARRATTRRPARATFNPLQGLATEHDLHGDGQRRRPARRRPSGPSPRPRSRRRRRTSARAPLFNESDQPAARPRPTTRQRSSSAWRSRRRRPVRSTGVRFWKVRGRHGHPHRDPVVRRHQAGRGHRRQREHVRLAGGDFASPGQITAGTTYVASYTAPNGRYGYTADGLAEPITNGPLSSLGRRRPLHLRHRRADQHLDHQLLRRPRLPARAPEHADGRRRSRPATAPRSVPVDDQRAGARSTPTCSPVRPRSR